MTEETPNTSATVLAPKKFDINALIARVKFVLKDPKGCWTVIKLELEEPIDLLKKYALPLIGVSQLAAYIKTSVIGVGVPYFGTWRAPLILNFINLLFQAAVIVGMLYVSALIFQKLAEKFGGTAKFSDTFKLIVYSNTAAWVAGIFYIVPFIWPLAFLAGFVYGVYTLFNGVGIMTTVPPERKLGYFVVSVLASGFAGMIIFMTVGGIFNPQPPVNADLQKLQENFQKLMPGNQ